MINRLIICFLFCFNFVYFFAQSWTINHYSKSNILPTNFINSIAQDRKGGLLLASDIGLYRFNGASVEEVYPNVFYKKVFTYGDHIYALNKENSIDIFHNQRFKERVVLPTNEDVIDITFSNKQLFFVTPNRLVVLMDDTWQEINSIRLKNSIGFLEGKYTTMIITENSIFEYKNQKIETLFSFQDRLVSVDLKEDKLIVATSKSLSKYIAQKDGFIQYSVEEYTNIENVALLNGVGEVVIQNERVQVSFAQSNDVLTNPLFFKGSFNFCFIDLNGGLWLSQKGRGLFNIPNPEIVRYASDGVINNVVNWNGSTVYGTNQGLLIKNSHGDYSTQLTDYRVNDSKVIDSTLFIATQLGVFKVGMDVTLDQISKVELNKIEVDEVNQLIYGSTDNKGLAVIDQKTKEIKFIQIKNGLSHNIISDIEIINKDTLIICTPAGGLDIVCRGRIIDGSKYKFNQRLIFNTLFYNAKTHDLYCATPNNGIFSINNRKEITAIPFEHSIYSIFEIDNIIWVTHDAGLNLINSKQQNIQIFEPNDPTEFLPFANGMYQSENEIYLGINDGYLKINPRSNYFNNNLSYSYRSVEINDKPSIPDSIISLSYGAYRFKFLIDYTNLYSRKSNVLQWRMLGYNEDWITMKKNTIEFPRLNFGEYTLEIRLKNGKVLDKLKTIIIIEKPVWLKPWFWMFSFFLIVGLIIVFSYFRNKALIKEKRTLEKVIRERTKAISQKNEELRQFSYVVSHDFKNPVVNIRQLAELALDKDVPEEKRIEITTHIKSSSQSLHSQLLGMIDLLKIGSENLPKTKLNIIKVCNEIERTLESQINESGVKLKYNKEIFELISNQQYVYSILYNLISNAIKYRNPDRKLNIEVICKETKKGKSIMIKDNGLGFDIEKQKDSLFQPFKRIHANGEGSGIGLALVKKMVSALNGKIFVKSTEGEGSEFEIMF